MIFEWEHLTTHITLVDAILSSVCHLMYHQVWSLGERLFTHITLELERPHSSVRSLVTVHFHVRAGCECFSAYVAPRVHKKVSSYVLLVARMRLLSGACLLMCCQGCSVARSFFARITLKRALSGVHSLVFSQAQSIMSQQISPAEDSLFTHIALVRLLLNVCLLMYFNGWSAA